MKEVQLYIPPRALSILEIQLRICAQRINAGNSFTCNSKHSFFKFDVQVGWTNIILLSFHLQTYCIRKKVSERGIKYLNKFNSITNNGK